MRIAVASEKGKVFQYFKKSPAFMIYETAAGKILASLLLENAQPEGRSIAALLKAAKVDVVICGGIGESAFAALKEKGLEVVSGVFGDTDEVVTSYLEGTLRYCRAATDCDS